MEKLKKTKKDMQRSIEGRNPYKTLLHDASFLFEDKVLELSLLRRVGDILGCIFDLESFYRMFVDILLEETDAENCSFMMMDTEANSLALKMARGRNDYGTFFDHPKDSEVMFSLGEGVAGKAALTREMILIDDVREDKRFEVRENCFPISSLLCTPLVFREKVLGVINLSHSQPHVFNQNTKRIMTLLCTFVSSIIGNAIDYIKVKVQEKFRAMFEGVRLSILIIDPGTCRIIDCNRYTEEWLGYNKEELVSIEHAFDILTPGYREKAEEILREIIEKNSSKLSEISFIKKDGRVNIGEINGTTINYQGRNLVQITVRDITERKEAEEKLKKSEERYHNLIKSANVGIIVSEGGKITTVNKRAEKIYGYSREELIGQSPSIVTPEKYRIQHREMLDEILKTGKTEKAVFEEESIRKDGSHFPVEISYSLTQGEKRTVIAVMRDISERKEMEEKLLQSEKLKSLGELAGGVAHDFNNVLAAILGRVQLLRMNVETSSEKREVKKSPRDLRRNLEIIEKAALDGAETVRRIQEFSRRRVDDKEFTQININELIEHALEFTRVRWKNDAESRGVQITIQKEFSPLPPMAGIASELREVFTNLINNAIDAMPQGGKIKIKTLKKDSHIYIKVEDTGIGIPRAMRNKIFDPFLTTKGVQSTGLGLSVSYGIVDRHRGTIKVNSIENRGTAFTIQFPIDEKGVEERKVGAEPKRKRKAKVLVIEDEKEVCELLSDILIGGGHKVEIAYDGGQGLKIFKEKKFDLVITDLGMPGMSGWQVAERIKGIDGRIPVAMITGWDIKIEESEMREGGVDLIIHKPFEVDQILSLVQKGMAIRDRLKTF